jgi:hypothetical protein
MADGGFVNALRLTTDSRARTSLSTWAIKAGGDLIDLPGGTVTLGLGAEYRDDTYETSIDQNSKDGNIIGSGGPQSTTSARRNVQSAPDLSYACGWPRPAPRFDGRSRGAGLACEAVVSRADDGDRFNVDRALLCAAEDFRTRRLPDIEPLMQVGVGIMMFLR